MCGLRPGSAVTNDHNVDEGSEIRLLGGPSQLLLETTDVRLRFDRDNIRTGVVVQNAIDDASRRPQNGHLERRPPPWMEDAEQGFEHPCLVTVTERRSGTRKESDAQVGAERDRNPVADFARRSRVSTLDFAEMGGTHLRCARQTAESNSRVLPLPADVGSNRPELGSGDGRRAALDLGTSHAAPECPCALVWRLSGASKPPFGAAERDSARRTTCPCVRELRERGCSAITNRWGGSVALLHLRTRFRSVRARHPRRPHAPAGRSRSRAVREHQAPPPLPP